MGEIADGMIEAEMLGIDYEDYLLMGDKPISPEGIAIDARLLISSIDEWADEDALPTTAELIEVLFPKLGRDQAQMIADGLKLLAEQYNG